MKSIKTYVITGFIFMLSLAITGRAQNIDSALAKFRTASPFEKAYIQFDNNKYVPGQTIWYKVYLMSGFGPSLLSKTFYIDWYDDKGKLISSIATPSVNSYSTGSFTLPTNYTGRLIHAIGYTKWMRNFDSSYFYRQTFPVISSATKIEEKDFVLNETTIQFLPESGTMISNKINVIAFKAVNKIGLPENINGIIKNSRGDSITSFRSVHDGMGKFEMIPLSNERYVAAWRDLRGKIYQTNLPLSAATGVNLIIEPGSVNRIFHIQRTTEVPDHMKQLTLVGQMNGTIYFKAKLDLSGKESITSRLPINKLLSGILQLTVFDANMQPLCERLIFVKNDDYILNTIVKADTINTRRRGKNVIEIELKDSTYANLSIAITDALTNDLPGNTIISQLLLKSDLTGNVYRPAYYFESNADSINNHLDLVMLTNGWRRYKWDEILNNPQPVFRYSKDSAYQSIKGEIKNYVNRKTKQDSINILFVSKDSSISMATLPVMTEGSFSGSNLIFYDTAKVYYRLNGSDRVPENGLIIKNDFLKASPEITDVNVQENLDTTGLGNTLHFFDLQKKADSFNKSITLQEVRVYGKERTRIQQLDLKYANGIFSQQATASFDMSTMENASHTQSIFDFLTGKVFELVVGDAGGTATAGAITYRRAPVTFYLNEFPILESEANFININDVAYIKVFSPPFVGGFNASGGEIASGGAIAIYTKRGSDIVIEGKNAEIRGTDYQTLVGYAPVKEFYSPNYAEAAQSNNTTVDLRSTLLWNPWINLNKHHQKIKLSFYNNDVTHIFRLVLEGMDGKGRLVHIDKLLK